jgi:hypothetical protein
MENTPSKFEERRKLKVARSYDAYIQKTLIKLHRRKMQMVVSCEERYGHRTLPSKDMPKITPVFFNTI